MIKSQGRSSVINVVITLIIILLLIFSGPSSAVMVNLNMDDLNGKEVGGLGFFYFNVVIGGNERIPITNFTLEGLPDISGSPDGKLVFNLSDCPNVGNTTTKGSYEIELVERSGWVGSSGGGWGYESSVGDPPYSGYGYGYHFPGYGYGYGYGSSGAQHTTLKYKITVNTAGATAGTYNMIGKVNTGNSNKPYFSTTASFILCARAQAPASITNLRNTTYKQTYINWTWNDPADPDFSKVMVYLDGRFQTNVTKGIRCYNATGLDPDSEYEIATHTVDNAKNINDTWVNHTARTSPSTAESCTFDTGPGTYPSIYGVHRGNFTPKCDIIVHRMYTYPCEGTVGHSKRVTFCEDGTEIGNGTWSGCSGDYHNITFETPFTLHADVVYNYEIVTGSYPQIIHRTTWERANGTITCTEFIGVNGKMCTNRIPAIRLE